MMTWKSLVFTKEPTSFLRGHQRTADALVYQWPQSQTIEMLSSKHSGYCERNALFRMKS